MKKPPSNFQYSVSVCSAVKRGALSPVLSLLGEMAGVRASLCSQLNRSAPKGGEGECAVDLGSPRTTHHALRNTPPCNVVTSHPFNENAFSLIEILVAVGLMSFIVLGLLITFNHVSRVFRSGMGAVDFLAAGRTTTENIMRELEQMTPSSAPYTINFLADQPRITPNPSLFTQPLVQALPGTTAQRVNSIQELFFLTKFNQDFIATGYKVIPNPGSDCVGSLYRYSATNRVNLPGLTTAFLAAGKTNLSLVADGVVNFRVTAFATNGFRILPNPALPGRTNAIFLVKSDPNLAPFGPYAINSSTAYWSGSVLDQVDYYFVSNAVPAYVELEIGILEPATLERYRSIGSPAAARDYLSNHVAQVHLFRQRATIRNVDYSAYVSQ